LWDDVQRLGQSWDHQKAYIAQLEEERNRIWTDLKKLGHSWEEQKTYITQLEQQRDPVMGRGSAARRMLGGAAVPHRVAGDVPHAVEAGARPTPDRGSVTTANVSRPAERRGRPSVLRGPPQERGCSDGAASCEYGC